MRSPAIEPTAPFFTFARDYSVHLVYCTYPLHYLLWLFIDM